MCSCPTRFMVVRKLCGNQHVSLGRFGVKPKMLHIEAPIWQLSVSPCDARCDVRREKVDPTPHVQWSHQTHDGDKDVRQSAWASRAFSENSEMLYIGATVYSPC